MGGVSSINYIIRTFFNLKTQFISYNSKTTYDDQSGIFLQLDIWQNEIIPKLDLKSIIRLISTCRITYYNLCVVDMRRSESFSLNKKLTDEILLQYKFRDLKYLYAPYENSAITNINHLQNLEYLDARYETGINQYGISKLKNITYLNIDMNSKITNVNHLKKLTHLIASGNCGLDQDGISELENLIKINLCDNKKITDLNHLKKLQDANLNHTIIDQQGISQLKKIKKLKSMQNPKITNIDHLPEIKSWWGDRDVDFFYDKKIDDLIYF